MNQIRSFVTRLHWKLILFSVLSMNSWFNINGFQILHSRFRGRRYPTFTAFQNQFHHKSYILWNHEDSKDSSSLLGSDGTIDDDTSRRRNLSRRRVGGRSKSNSSSRRKEERDDVWRRNLFLLLSRSWKQWTLPILIAGFLLSSSLFGRMGRQTQQSYVFYQSNVYETRIVSSDGKIQTSRQETIRTNIPQVLRDDTQTESKETTNSKIVITKDDFDISELEQDIKSTWENLLY
jgi:hypothetical protein